MSKISNHGKATSFADPADVEAFRKWYKRYLDTGMSKDEAEQAAFKKGDNGEGLWGDDTSEGSGPSCAIPPDDLQERWGGSKDNKWIESRHKKVYVTIGDVTITCLVKDRMPWKKNITNGAIIDLNPDAVKQLGQKVPLDKQCHWSWVDDE